jgi:CRP-like cAMP-binding protein
MALQQDIITFIRKKGEAVKASELALAFDLTKTEINSELYSLQGIILQRTESNPPYWSFLPLEDQILNIVPHTEDDPMTAREIAEVLCVTKNEVNSILYRLEGDKTRQEKEDIPAPYWYLIDE